MRDTGEVLDSIDGSVASLAAATTAANISHRLRLLCMQGHPGEILKAAAHCERGRLPRALLPPAAVLDAGVGGQERLHCLHNHLRPGAGRRQRRRSSGA